MALRREDPEFTSTFHVLTLEVLQGTRRKCVCASRGWIEVHVVEYMGTTDPGKGGFSNTESLILPSAGRVCCHWESRRRLEYFFVRKLKKAFKPEKWLTEADNLYISSYARL